MIVRMFAVYDGVARAFATPFFMRSDGEALRAFSSEVNNPQSSLNRNASDFTLHVLGDFDDSSGEFTSAPARLASAASLLVPVQKDDV